MSDLHPFWNGLRPTEKQLEALRCPARELLYGGQAAGAKSYYLLMEASLYAMSPYSHSLLLRRTFADLSLPDALMSIAHEWWFNEPGVHWNDRTKTYTFPSGATVTFGYLDGPRDHLRYQGAQLTMIGIDEASQCRENQIMYLMSRLRRPSESNVPLRFRLCSNPGDISHHFLKSRYVESKEEDKVFIAARMEDNPHLNTEEYMETLSELDDITYKQLALGDWDVAA